MFVMRKTCFNCPTVYGGGEFHGANLGLTCSLEPSPAYATNPQVTLSYVSENVI